MAKMIQIRNVPDELHRKMKIKAAKHGVTLSELLLRLVRDDADRPDLDELRKRILSRQRVKLSRSAAEMLREERDRR